MTTKTKDKVVIFDLDGTLANIEHRRGLVSNGNSDWPNFYRECVKDTVNLPVAVMFNLLSKNYKTAIFSGRSAVVLEETKKWLKNNKIKPDYLTLRPENDYRPDEELKKGMLENFLLENNLTREDILCIFDDRDKVVRMWRAEGLTCLQVAEGGF